MTVLACLSKRCTAHWPMRYHNCLATSFNFRRSCTARFTFLLYALFFLMPYPAFPPILPACHHYHFHHQTAAISLNRDGYAYIPTTCQNLESCRLHVQFHGCQQTLSQIGTQVIGSLFQAKTNMSKHVREKIRKSRFICAGCVVYKKYNQFQAKINIARAVSHLKKKNPYYCSFALMHTNIQYVTELGLNEYAESNAIVILYPQTITSFFPTNNPNGTKHVSFLSQFFFEVAVLTSVICLCF
jgi:hypothetical protein